MLNKNDGADQIRYGPGGGSFQIITSCCDTDNRQFVMAVTEPPGGGPPLHVHSREDEFFFVLEGEVTLWKDGRISKAAAGCGAFMPRSVPHTFKNRSKQPLKVLVVCTPGDIEPFFDYGAVPEGSAHPSDQELIERINALRRPVRNHYPGSVTSVILKSNADNGEPGDCNPWARRETDRTITEQF